MQSLLRGLFALPAPSPACLFFSTARITTTGTHVFTHPEQAIAAAPHTRFFATKQNPPA